MVECKRCGQCCFFIIDGKLTNNKCDYLLIDKFTKLTTCIIYDNPNRISILCGTVDKENFYCNERKNTPYDYLGCPYNKNKKVVKLWN